MGSLWVGYSGCKGETWPFHLPQGGRVTDEGFGGPWGAVRGVSRKAWGCCLFLLGACGVVSRTPCKPWVRDFS